MDGTKPFSKISTCQSFRRKRPSANRTRELIIISTLSSDDSEDQQGELDEEDVSFSSISVSEAQTMDPFRAQKAKMAKVLDEVANDPETDSMSRRISIGNLKIYI